jgi:hypothetical protein
VLLGDYNNKLSRKLEKQCKSSIETIVLPWDLEIKLNSLEMLEKGPEINGRFNLEWL